MTEGAAVARVASARRRLVTQGTATRPAVALLELARRVDASITLDEYALARCIASEHGNGSPAEMACVADAVVALAERKKLSAYEHLTGGTDEFGPQGGKRSASTRQHPNERHVAAAREVLSGSLRGIALGGRRFFNPRAQERFHRAWKAGESTHKHTCGALGLLRAWCYDLPPCKGVGRCCADGQPPAANPGPHPEAWVGPIAGVDPWRLMLMRPSKLGPEHDAAFDAARAVIESAAADLPRMRS